MTNLETRYQELTARHRADDEVPWWQQPRIGQGRHAAADLCPTEDDRRRSEVQQRQRHSV